MAGETGVQKSEWGYKHWPGATLLHDLRKVTLHVCFPHLHEESHDLPRASLCGTKEGVIVF